jgi:hypothetical protein
MIKLLLLLFLLVSACVAIHGLGMIIGLRWLARTWPRRGHSLSLPATFWIIVRVVYGLLILHLLQILVWAACFHWNGCFAEFKAAFYYSASSYSTVGYGDVAPPAGWEILGAIEAVTGVIMFGWSTGVLFSVVNHLLTNFHAARAVGESRE